MDGHCNRTQAKQMTINTRLRLLTMVLKTYKIKWLFTFHVKVEEQVCLSPNAGHVVNEVGQRNVVLQHNVQRQGEKLRAWCEQSVPTHVRWQT